MRLKIKTEGYVQDSMLESKALKGAQWRKKMCIYGGVLGFPFVVLVAFVFRKHEFAKFIGVGAFGFLVTAGCLILFRVAPKCPHCHKRTKEHYEKAIHPDAILYVCKRCKIYADSGMRTD